MNDNKGFKVSPGDLISSPSSQYEVQDILGSGSFGVVAQCRRVESNQQVALKIIVSERGIQEGKEEAEVLRIMRDHGSEAFNIIKLNASFIYQHRFHLEFEKLDISLLEFKEKSGTLDLKEIRPIIQQLATALDFLTRIGLVHADLKPENVMMVDHVRQPLKVKLIDFGWAINNLEAWRGHTLQTLWYRSPEVLLGAPFDGAIDVWSLGCTAAELVTGIALFPGCDDYDMIRHIISIIGKPPDRLLNAGWYTCYHASALRAYPNDTSCTVSRLEDLIRVPRNLSGEDARVDDCDWEYFVDLLSKMLAMDPLERITPSDILRHPFITMSHLTGSFNDNPHVKTCMELMGICEDQSSYSGEDGEEEKISDSPATLANPANTNSPDEDNPARSSSEKQPFLPLTTVSAPKKRKRDGDDESENINRSSDTKKRRIDHQYAAVTGAHLSPKKSPQHKRNTDAAGLSCEEQRLLTTTTVRAPKKRKWDSVYQPESSNRSPDIIPAKRRRIDHQDAADTGAQTSQKTSLQRKRKRDEADTSKPLDSNKERRSREEARFSSTQKRKRDDEEASGSEEKSPEDKKKRTSQHK